MRRQNWDQGKAARWRWQAAKLRASAAVAADDAAREQLMILAADCEEEARAEDSAGDIEWRRA